MSTRNTETAEFQNKNNNKARENLKNLKIVKFFLKTVTFSMNSNSNGATLEYEGCNFMRMRLVLATLSGRALRISKIRSKDITPGLKEFEASLIRLFDKITNGSKIKVSETGTSFSYTPGLLVGGKMLETKY